VPRVRHARRRSGGLRRRLRAGIILGNFDREATDAVQRHSNNFVPPLGACGALSAPGNNRTVVVLAARKAVNPSGPNGVEIKKPEKPRWGRPDTTLTSSCGLFLPRYLPMTGKLPRFAIGSVGD
jgi:hypothetical protein